MSDPVRADPDVLCCPDDGHCHHKCNAGCFRVLNCGPLSGVYPDDTWPAEVKALHKRAEAPDTHAWDSFTEAQKATKLQGLMRLHSVGTWLKCNVGWPQNQADWAAAFDLWREYRKKQRAGGS